MLNLHILPAIVNYRLRDISPMQIQAIMASLSGKSHSLQSKVLSSLRSIFNVAQENGLVAKSPVSQMLKPTGKKAQEKKSLTPQESQLLLERVQNAKAKMWLAAQRKISYSKYVIAMKDHKPLSKSAYRSMWRLVERELPGHHATAHILRHTYITRLFEAGLDIKEVP